MAAATGVFELGDCPMLGRTLGCGRRRSRVRRSPDPVQVGVDLDPAADPGRVVGVVVGIEADVVVAGQPDRLGPTDLWGDRWRQHRCPVGGDPVTGVQPRTRTRGSLPRAGNAVVTIVSKLVMNAEIEATTSVGVARLELRNIGRFLFRSATSGCDSDRSV